MSKALAGYVIPRLHYFIPITVLLGSFVFWTGYKLYYSKPAQKRKYHKNEEYANQLWEMTGGNQMKIPQEGKFGHTS